MMENNNLKKAVQMYDFYLLELNLYLDTHPTDMNALRMFNEYKKLRDIAVNSYVQKYGLLTADQSNSDTKFNWVDDPWPWERSAN